MAEHQIELNGATASADDLRAIALVNYGQFTSMQVQDGCVRGLDLHLDRLDHATRELFGCPLDVERTRGWMRRLVGDRSSSLSLRVNIFSRALNRARLDVPAAPDVLALSIFNRTTGNCVAYRGRIGLFANYVETAAKIARVQKTADARHCNFGEL